MGLLKKIYVNGQKLRPETVTKLALEAVDSIAMTGFDSTEELYSLLKVNCMGSDIIIDEALKELASTYNNRAAKFSDQLHNNLGYPGLKESYITNIVRMDDKLKMIADVRSYMAMQTISSDDLDKLPMTTKSEDLVDVSNIITSIAAALPDNDNGKKIPVLNFNKKEG